MPRPWGRSPLADPPFSATRWAALAVALGIHALGVWLLLREPARREDPPKPTPVFARLVAAAVPATSSPAQPAPAPAPPPSPPAPPPPTPPAPPPEPAPEPAPLDLTSRLPAPRVTTGSLFASVPKPGKTKGAVAEDNGGRRRVVTLKPAPAAAAALAPDSDDDDDRAAKRRKTAPTGGAGLRAALPKPKNALGAGGPAGGLELGAGGGGAQLDLGAGDAAGHRSAAGPTEPSNAAPHPSRLYAVDESGAYAYDADAQARYHAEYARYYGHPHEPAARTGEGGESHPPGVGLEEASRRKDAGPGSFDVDAVMRRAGVDGSTVRGISAAELRASGGDRIRESATTGLAFDDEYRDKLTREAGHAPSLVHKSKNQIGSLLYNAKQAELKIMEGRLQGVSHKAQARQKYGW